MTTLTLYTNTQSRGRIAHWMLEETGASYDTVWVDYGPPMKSPEYLAINPMGKVPALVHGEAVVTECAAICAYLGDRFPANHLAPAIDDPRRATYLRWLFFAAGPLEAAVTARSFGWQIPEGRNQTAGFGSYTDTLNALEGALQQGPWLCGEQFTAADVYIASQLGWGMMFDTIEKRSVFQRYVERAYARPANIASDRLNGA
ncbi:glutathione S-transferase [Halopseudomonas sabulinigri]|uniref:Glutathione S-transferase n=1 Tax=Halopseudomonas sabulinigri TaxID=472181 RepID=A0A1H1S0Z2_9GAMM|nr:glutathione S-transferase family protein [Halopseudomonas sabulinigri]SDS41637.1 glutathione S-transferase [Halopseudomonas sabulinigri]